jgi:uncharacterized membrane protein YphA (DoxX/SURF4 family)
MSGASALSGDRRRWGILLAARITAAVLGAVFLLAGLTKAQDAAAFFRDLEGFRIFPAPAAVVLAYFVPALEIVAGAAVLAPRWRRAAALVLGTLLAGYLVLLAMSWARGLAVTCGCFGGTGNANYPLLLGQDAILLSLAAFVFRGSASASPPPSSTP